MIALPFFRRLCFYTSSGDVSELVKGVGTTTTVSVCKALVAAFALEHALSVIGIVGVLRRKLDFDHRAWRLTIPFLVCNSLGGATFIVFVAAGAY